MGDLAFIMRNLCVILLMYFCGEAEESICEMLELIRNWKKDGKPGDGKKSLEEWLR